MLWWFLQGPSSGRELRLEGFLCRCFPEEVVDGAKYEGAAGIQSAKKAEGTTGPLRETAEMCSK